MIKANRILPLIRLPKYKEYSEVKDPSVVFADGKWYMYASICHPRGYGWLIGRFVADTPEGPWQELEPVELSGIQGPQVCAPAVIYDEQSGPEHWRMYIQTACFEENSVIAEASSRDGQVFTSMHASLISSESIDTTNPHKVVGVYDAGISDVTMNGEEYMAMIFSGYRKVGSGDIYVTWKKKNDKTSNWVSAKMILQQEDVPFHNNPLYEHYEWGLEGGKILQVKNDTYLFIGVCFLPLPAGHEGKRQRVFIAASQKLDGPYIPIGTPFPPQQNDNGSGEHGHPDIFIYNNDLCIIYQERNGQKHPWHLRYAVLDLDQYLKYAETHFITAPYE